MKTFRETFEENYAAVEEPCGNKKGFKIRYVYVGLWHGWDVPGEQLRKEKRRLAALCALSVLPLLIGGMVNSPLNRAGLVQIPAMIGLAAAVFEVFGAVQFCAAKERLSKMDFDDINAKLKVAPLVHGVCLALAALAGAALLLAGDRAGRDAAVPLCFALSAALTFVLLRRYRALPQKKTKNENAKANQKKNGDAKEGRTR